MRCPIAGVFPTGAHGRMMECEGSQCMFWERPFGCMLVKAIRKYIEKEEKKVEENSQYDCSRM